MRGIYDLRFMIYESRIKMCRIYIPPARVGTSGKAEGRMKNAETGRDEDREGALHDRAPSGTTEVVAEGVAGF